MSGLYIREMLNRRLLSRVLVVPPAGLVLNWERELNGLFGLPFRVVGGGEGRSGNPFLGPESDLLIVSVDTLAAERLFGRLQELDVEPYDLVIFDEVHKLSADREPDFTVRKTDRYRLAEALAGILQRRSAARLAARLERPAPLVTDSNAAHGEGLPLLFPLAAAATRRSFHLQRLVRLPG